MKQDSLEMVSKKLFRLGEMKFGKDWREHIRSELWKEEDDQLNDAVEIRTYFKDNGYDLIGAGYYRIVFGYRNVAIKIDCNKYSGNRKEFTSYTQVTKAIPLAKYFICPILKAIELSDSFVLCYPKVEILGDEGLEPTKIQKRMWNIEKRLFEDLHKWNVGKFCGGLVASDFNFGSWYTIWDAENIERFSKRFPTFWKKYTKEFDNTVKQIKVQQEIN